MFSNLQAHAFGDPLAKTMRLVKHHHMIQNESNFAQVSTPATTSIRRKLGVQQTFTSLFNFFLCTDNTHLDLLLSMLTLFLVYSFNKNSPITVSASLPSLSLQLSGKDFYTANNTVDYLHTIMLHFILKRYVCQDSVQKKEEIFFCERES